MASSDDEGETVPQAVSNYHFVNDKDEPISFAELPVTWHEDKTPDGGNKQIFLHGTTDNGLQKVYKLVTAWKFDLSFARPEISVLSKENNWISLLKPRKSFEDTIRTILITVHCLHYLKKNPEVSGKALWDHLSKVPSLHEIRPSENDLVVHMNFIADAVKRDEGLAKSKFLVTFLEDKPRKREAIDEDVGNKTMSGFITDDYMIDENEEDGSDEEADLFDSVCAICDNGGKILPCEGRCLRSFHATVDAGSDSICESLGLSDEQVEAIQNFFCKNCQYKQHQCFACGKLGSSDKSTGAEVFSCVSATCGRFYHPHCVAKLLHRDEAAAEELEKKIAAGDSFTCPIHKCCVCKQGENKMEPGLQFAVCRRCPKSYHRKCLPRKISFEDLEDEGIIQRAWEGLIPDRILIYCLKHEIDDEIGTPIRDHIKFPNIGPKKKRPALELPSSREEVTLKERSLASKDTSGKRIVKLQKGVDKASSAIKQGDSSRKREPILSGSVASKKQKLTNASREPLNKASSTSASKTSLGEMLYAYMNKDSEPVKSSKDDTTVSELEQTQTAKPLPKKLSSSPPLDADSKRRIMALMKEATSSVTLEEIVKQHKVPSTHTSSSRYLVDKTITLGKVEGSIEAVRAALKKLEDEKCTIEDAKAVCEPGILNQIIKWKSKLRVYLAPFLLGMRYTSFGRHFTKVDKLREIANILRWYVQDGDTVVDFCCGANDFSCLVKKRLDEMGKNCSYKNYDVLQAKSDFNFEKRDWMTVTPKELPPGSQLIMGLNPPFGVHASLANKFINKALEFRPKLIVLIVPQETERLDKKKSPYDLVWEDDELLAGKAFYFPGSVDINDKQIDQWNNSTPPLYLWSRPDWTAKYKAIAQQHGHLSRVVKEPPLMEPAPDLPIEEPDLDIEMSISIDHPVENEEKPVDVEQPVPIVTESPKNPIPCDTGEKEGHVKNHSNENSKKKRRGGKRSRKSSEVSSVDNPKVSSSSPSHRSPNYTAGGKSVDRDSSKPPFEAPSHTDACKVGYGNVERGISGSRSQYVTGFGDSSKPPTETPSHTDVGKEGYENVERGVSRSRSQYGTGYGGTRDDGLAWKYNVNSEEPYPGGTRDDEVVRRYNVNNEDPYASSIFVRSNVANYGPEYGGVRNLDEQFTGYRRESIERSGGSLPPYVEDMSRPPHYGRQEPDPISQRSSYLGRLDSGFSSPYVHHLGSITELSYNRTCTSTMQRYAPRLDELNHTTRMTSSSLGSDLHQPFMNRSGPYDPLAPRPGGFRPDPLAFAPGLYGPHAPHNSSGWLNE
ncbi:hypothetical protein LguiA_035670 [Lonicera macranthoides]